MSHHKKAQCYIGIIHIQSAFHTQKAVINWKTEVNLWHWTITGLNRHACTSVLIDIKDINGNICILVYKTQIFLFFLNSWWRLISNNSWLVNKMLLRKDQQTNIYIYDYWLCQIKRKNIAFWQPHIFTNLWIFLSYIYISLHKFEYY